jgi:hypothetical protein
MGPYNYVCPRTLQIIEMALAVPPRPSILYLDGHKIGCQVSLKQLVAL